jgi:hypothetical protein
MKFNCGRTYTWHEWVAYRAQWRPWFAWHPVRLGEYDCRWLEIVERRHRYEGSYGGGYWLPEYRAKNSINEEVK